MKQDFFPDRNRWTITAHVDTKFIQHGINDVIGFSKMPAAGRRKERTKVSDTVCMNRVLSSLPKNETWEDLVWSTKVKLGEDENTVTVLYVMHSRLSIVLSLPFSHLLFVSEFGHGVQNYWLKLCLHYHHLLVWTHLCILKLEAIILRGKREKKVVSGCGYC